MKEFLLNLESIDKIGIYRFDTDGFSVGNIIKIWDNYLFLKSYDTQNDEDGMKIYQIDKIQRIILDSDYIKNLGSYLLDKTESSYEWLYTKNLNSIDDILENIIIIVRIIKHINATLSFNIFFILHLFLCNSWINITTYNIHN